MADSFDKAYQRTMGHEGGYVHDPDDPGGETYKGISRKWHPSWPGWRIVDAHKPLGTLGPDEVRELDHKLASHEELQSLVGQFYRDRFWDPAGCPYLPPLIALEVFDTAVNMGEQDAVCYLQQALNLLNRNGRLFGDVAEDGRFGPQTLGAMEALPPREVALLHKVMNILQGCHYIRQMRRSPVKEKYARGWLKRVIVKA